MEYEPAEPSLIRRHATRLVSVFVMIAAMVGSRASARSPAERSAISDAGWESGGPYGGTVRSLASSPNEPKTLYAGSEHGLYKSDDGGETWRELQIDEDSSRITNVYQVVMAPSDASVVYVAYTFRALLRSCSTDPFPVFGSNVLRSGDAGETWSLISGPWCPGFEPNLLVDPTDGDTIYVFPGGDTYKSTDGGQSFTHLEFPGVPRALDPTVSSTLYSYGFRDSTAGLYKSVDGGETWDPTGFPPNVTPAVLAVDPIEPRIVYAAGPGFFLRSPNAGGTWASIPTTPAGSPQWLTSVPESTPVLYIGTESDGVWRSFDRGNTWLRVGSPGSPVLSLAPSVDSLYAGTFERGVFVSKDDGRTWAATSSGILSAHIDRVAVSASDPRFAYALGAGFSSTEDGGVTWNVDYAAPAVRHGAIAVDPANPSVVYVSDADGGLWKSANRGATWVRTIRSTHVISSIAIDPSTPTILYLADGRALKSTDGGATWHVIAHGIPDGVELIAVDPTNSSVVYASTGNDSTDGLYRSDDAGETWRLLAPRATFGLAIDILLLDPAHAGTIYAKVLSETYKTTDGGATWSLLPAFTLALTPDSGLTCDPSGVLYGVGYYGIYFFATAFPVRSLDGGTNFSPIGRWGPQSSRLPHALGSVAVDGRGTRLYAATDRGVWQTRVPRRTSVIQTER